MCTSQRQLGGEVRLPTRRPVNLYDTRKAPIVVDADVEDIADLPPAPVEAGEVPADLQAARALTAESTTVVVFEADTVGPAILPERVDASSAPVEAGEVPADLQAARALTSEGTAAVVGEDEPVGATISPEKVEKKEIPQSLLVLLEAGRRVTLEGNPDYHPARDQFLKALFDHLKIKFDPAKYHRFKVERKKYITRAYLLLLESYGETIKPLLPTFVQEYPTEPAPKPAPVVRFTPPPAPASVKGMTQATDVVSVQASTSTASSPTAGPRMPSNPALDALLREVPRRQAGDEASFYERRDAWVVELGKILGVEVDIKTLNSPLKRGPLFSRLKEKLLERGKRPPAFLQN